MLDPWQAVEGLPAGTTILYIGSLGLAAEPTATSLVRLVARLPRHIMVMLDLGFYPAAAASWQGYLDRLRQILPRVDVIKTSAKDICSLFPAASVEDAASRLVSAGLSTALVTEGSSVLRAFCAGKEMRAEVRDAEIAEIMGAEDVLGGAFLAWWAGNGLVTADLRKPAAVHAAIQAAMDAAEVFCNRCGVEPPRPHELAGHHAWASLLVIARPTETTDRDYGVSPGPRPAWGPAGRG